MSGSAAQSDSATVAEYVPGNTVAVMGLILTVVACLMCGVLFAAASRLPEEQSLAESTGVHVSARHQTVNGELPDGGNATELRDNETEAEHEADTQARELQVLLLASAVAVLNLVGLVMSVAGLFVPHRPRTPAVCGMILALLLFAGVFGVVAVGAFWNPAVIGLN